ncbi:MAG: hypothetical protein ACREAL_08330 [Nitrosopumilaceae archaeon]
MNPRTSDDSLFSAGKPKKLPWFFVPVIIGLVALILIFKWFS